MSRKESDEKYRSNNPEQVRQAKKSWTDKNPTYTKDWHEKNPGKRAEYARRHRLKTLYGMTLEQYEQMLEEQEGVCAICHQPETQIYNGSLASLSVDHCHETGKIRGLLCIRCNRSLHDIAWHISALSYLELHA